jgi:hypothetical protein
MEGESIRNRCLGGEGVGELDSSPGASHTFGGPAPMRPNGLRLGCGRSVTILAPALMEATSFFLPQFP